MENTKVSKRAALNTTIRKEVLDDFRTYCKETGFPMGMVLEAFMESYMKGEFTLKVGLSKNRND